MKWVPLFVLTALVTGLHNLYGLMSMVNGAPINLLNLISLLGSAALLGAAVLLPFRIRPAAKVGLLGSLLSWVFYGPLVVSLPFSTWNDIQFDAKFHEYVPLVGMFCGPVLLILCTVNSIILLMRNRVTSQAL